GAEIDYRLMDVYEVDTFDQKFDYVLFMGVFYHLRYPLFALDKVARLPRERLVFQSMVRGPGDSPDVAPDYPITEKEIFEDPRFPAMYFIEHRYAGDPTNWWVPNEAGLEAMLRSAGLRIVAHPFTELWICEPATTTPSSEAPVRRGARSGPRPSG